MRSDEEQHAGFTELLKPHLDSLYRLAYRLTGTVSDAEDLLQEVLCKVFEREKELTSIADLGPWLGRVLYNRFIDDTRKQARRRLTAIDPDNLSSELIGPNENQHSPTPEAQAGAEFSINRLNKALASLSIEHRTVVLMHDAEGYQLNEIQSITGISLGTLKSRLHRARARLRELLGPDGTF
jgi:RNA polymerase sigma-70 factor (ECF subfamily)